MNTPELWELHKYFGTDFQRELWELLELLAKEGVQYLLL